MMCPRKSFSRREFLSLLLKGGVLALLGATFYPVLRYLKQPAGQAASVSSVVAAKIGDLKPNSAKLFRFGSKPGLLVHTPDSTYKAYSAVCTHLNCTVQYEEDDSIIWCACHNGKFDLNGQVISGPPPRGLDRYEVNVQGEDVIVSQA